MTAIYRFLSLFALVLAFGFGAAFAQATDSAQLPPQKLQIVGQGVVSEILKPDLIRLDTGVIYVLDNMRVPTLYTDQALAWLDKNLLNQAVTLYASPDLGDAARDRMGNTFAHAVIDGAPARWVQGDMIANGLAWADSTATNRSLITELLAIEDKARAGKQGFWASPGMAPRAAAQIGNQRDEFMVVTGTATRVTDKKSVVYANYGEDWKTDFTLRLTKPNRKNFPPAFSMQDLEGKPIRVRGWVMETNGPMIELTHFEQIEFLTDNKDATPQQAAPAQ